LKTQTNVLFQDILPKASTLFLSLMVASRPWPTMLMPTDMLLMSSTKARPSTQKSSRPTMP